jgi:hypothetical protein
VGTPSTLPCTSVAYQGGAGATITWCARSTGMAAVNATPSSAAATGAPSAVFTKAGAVSTGVARPVLAWSAISRGSGSNSRVSSSSCTTCQPSPASLLSSPCGPIASASGSSSSVDHQPATVYPAWSPSSFTPFKSVNGSWKPNRPELAV